MTRQPFLVLGVVLGAFFDKGVFMSNPFISVIIPVYNAETYLPACLESILAQDYSALEVVLVDDGSTDASPAICERYVQEHKDWRALHTENQGAGPARNTGMALARGEYLMFMDSDDLLAGPGAVGLLAELARREGADVVLGGVCRQGPEGGFFGRVAPGAEPAGVRRQVDFLFRAFFSQAFMVSLHGKLYRREFVEKNRLACGGRRLMEDKFFNLCCCACGPAYAFTQETVYLYRDNKSSATARYTPDMAGAWFGVAEDLKAFLISRGLEEEFAALVAFQVFFGLVSFVFHERAFRRQGLGAVAKAFGRQARIPLAAQTIEALSQGKYVGEVRSLAWRWGMRGMALACRRHWYGPVTWGLWTLAGWRKS